VASATVPSKEEKIPSIHSLQKIALVVTLATGAVAASAGYFWFARSGAHPSLNDSSIVVLPFADLSPGKDQEYFSDGLTEELINNLAKIPGLRVVARSSSFQFKGRNEDLRVVGQRLGVANVLEGSVRKEDNRVRITAALTKAGDGFQLWSETYNRRVGDIFKTQDEIARAVAAALQSKLLSTGSTAIPEALRTTNSEAYEAYLQGQYFTARGQDKEDLTKALFYSDQATKLDPDYAPAWAQQSLALQTMAAVALIDNVDGFRRARASAKKAIALDPKLAIGYLALAFVQINHDWDWEGAVASVKEASMLAPGSATVLNIQAYLERKLGRKEKAITLYKQAIALDPLRA